MRQFNRFYTPTIGLLQHGYLNSPYTLTQVRVLFELARGGTVMPSELARRLSLDPGYISRVIRSFVHEGLVERPRALSDGRQSLVALTDKGREVFADLDRRAYDGVEALLAGLSEADQARLVGALQTVERLLGEAPATPLVVLRSPRAGDLGWVVQAHGELYAHEYGWDATFEALVAEIVAAFGRDHDPQRERCWIAEKDGVNVGCIFCVRKSDDTAQLRLLLVDPGARGNGIGRKLVDECVRFARSAGYRRMVLWTNDVLVQARRIYEAEGFRLVEEERHHSFGHDLVGQTWEREL